MTEEKNTDHSPAASDADQRADSPSIQTSSVESSNSSADNVKQKTVAKQNTTPVVKKANSTLAIAALLLAFLSIGTTAGLYWWQLQTTQQARQHFTQNIAQQTQQQLQTALVNVSQDVEQQSVVLAQKQTELLNELATQYQINVAQLAQKIARLESRKPSEWILHEVEYLIRVAGRTMWLSQDTKAAISLLEDANLRLQELDDPKFLAVRKSIHQDIETLSLTPQLTNEDTVLSIMALAEQAPLLPIAMAQIPESAEAAESFELSYDPADWQQNLRKTWDKFLADFITITRRTGAVEPLMSPEHQRNLRENLALKLQLVQYAVIKQHVALYHKSLSDIDSWISEYFDLNSPKVTAFLKRIAEFKHTLITVDLPQTLHSLEHIRALKQNESSALSLTVPESASNTTTSEEGSDPQQTQNDFDAETKALETQPTMATDNNDASAPSTEQVQPEVNETPPTAQMSLNNEVPNNENKAANGVEA